MIDTNSLISKKTATTLQKPSYREKGLGFFVWFSGLMFFISLLAFGGVFFYKRVLNGEINELSASLDRAKAAFEPALITTLNYNANIIEAAKTLLAKHTAVSRVFDLLEDITLPGVRFTSFAFSIDKEGKPSFNMQGEAKSYTILAQQANLFEDHEQIEEALFSNFSLTSTGNVGFTVEATLKPETITYR